MSPHGSRPRGFRLGAGVDDTARDIARELAFHLETRTEQLIATGMDPAEARARAQELFGEMHTIQAECLDVGTRRLRGERRASWWHDLRQDATYAVRSLRRHRSFTLIVSLILALGIGANTATFTLINALLLRPLPVPHPRELAILGDPTHVGVTSSGSPSNTEFSYPLYRDLRDAEPGMIRLLASGRAGRLDIVVDTATHGGAPAAAEHPATRFVSENYFSVLGVGPWLGTLFPASAGSTPGDAPMVVVSHRWWTVRLGADRSAIGRTILVNRLPMTIAGVMPPIFSGEVVGEPVDIWVPLSMQAVLMPHRPLLEERGVSWLQVMGRRNGSVSLAQLTLRLDVAARRSIGAAVAQGDDPRFADRMDTLAVHEGARGVSYERNELGTALSILMGAVALVLLVVCANVANLILTRTMARRQELSVRLAIGAGRSRLVRQLFTEGLLLAALGGGAGVTLAIVGTRLLMRANAPAGRAAPLDVTPDWRVLAFALLAALGTAMIAGLLPALRASRVDIATALRSGGRGHTGGRRQPGRWLVMTQVALSLVLLVATGMLLRSLRHLAQLDLGMAREKLVVARVDLARTGFEPARQVALLQQVTARLEQVPGVAGVSFSGNGLYNGTENRSTIGVEGFIALTAADSVLSYDDVGPDYAAAIGANLLQGRDLTTADAPGAAPVVLVNRAFVERYFPHGSPLGHSVHSGTYAWQIVGVIGDVRDHGLRDPVLPRVYFPALQHGVPQQPVLLIRAAGSAEAMALTARKAIAGISTELPVLESLTVTARIASTLDGDRLMARTLTGFGVLALLLAALGLYGVMAYTTLRRTGEFGVRMALGAAPPAVARLVLREALVLMAGGLAAGIPLALGAAQLLRSRLAGVGTVDMVSLLMAVAALTASTLIAAWLPARRASRIGPLTALRAE